MIAVAGISLAIITDTVAEDIITAMDGTLSAIPTTLTAITTAATMDTTANGCIAEPSRLEGVRIGGDGTRIATTDWAQLKSMKVPGSPEPSSH